MSNQTKRLSEKEITDYLQKILADDPYTLRGYVAHEALSYGAQWFFTDIQRSGCSSGMIPSLVSYYDTRNFFDRNYDEIEELRQDYEDSTGEPLRVNGDLKNFFAWFAFEETSWRLAIELELD